MARPRAQAVRLLNAL
jgi:hypothetical protein